MSETNNIVVVYRSKSGYTKKYASWLAEELDCDLIPGNKTNADALTKYDTIIYGGGIYALGINGIKLITDNLVKFKSKKLIVFGVGESPVRLKNSEHLRKKNIPVEGYDRITFFYLRGGFDFSRLTLLHKIMMSLLKIKLKHIKNPDDDVKGMLDSYIHPIDFTDRKNLEPIVEEVRKQKSCI